MTSTTNLGLPFIEASQAQKHVTHNEALRVLDVLVMLSVIDRDLSAPPLSPVEGDRYLVKASGSGAFAGKDNQIANFADGAWTFYPPRLGWTCYVADESLLLAWNGNAWQTAIDVLGGMSALQNINLLGVGTSADINNPFSAKLNNALWTALYDADGGDGSLRYKLNKETAADTLSLLLQTGFSGRAEFGLTGDDDLTFKVSPDGSNFFTGFVVGKDNGQFRIPLAPKFSAYTNFDNYIAANSWTKVQFNDADSNAQNAFNGSNNNFTAPFAGTYVLDFSLRFKANATVPTKVIFAFYKNGAELGRGRVVSGAPVDDVTTYNLTVLTPLALNDVIDVRVNFATNDGYIESDQSHFWGHHVP